MNRLFALPAALAALTLTSNALALDDKDGVQDKAVEIQAVEVSVEPIEVEIDAEKMPVTIEASPVRLVEWTGDFELMKTSRRMRVWRSHLAYRLTVDAEGNVTDCELTETFRLRRVTDRLCSVLSEHHTFEPAHDESGNPIEGSYTARMSYMDIRDRL